MIRRSLVLLIVLAAGCSRVPKDVVDTPAPAVPEFSPKSGLKLPEQTQRALGVRVADVEERAVSAALAVTLRVYDADASHARSSGRLTPAQARRLRPGQPVSARAADGTTVTGSVVRLDERAEGLGGTGEVLVDFATPRGDLADALFVEATIPLDAGSRVTAVPASALLACSEGTFVYVVNGDSFIRTRVEAGMKDSDYVEVTDGLYEGDQVVVHPVLSLWMTELASVKGGQSCCAVSPEEN